MMTPLITMYGSAESFAFTLASMRSRVIANSFVTVIRDRLGMSRLLSLTVVPLIGFWGVPAVGVHARV